MNLLKHIRKIPMVFLCICMIFCFASCEFNTAKVSFADIKIKQALVSSTGGYYLADDGTLYSPGADTDAGGYVCYTDKKQGVVAKNIACFGTMSGGGWCITNDNELYVWNRDKIPFLRYTNNKHLQKVADNIKNVILTKGSAVYTDTAENLYILGGIGNRHIDFNTPELIATEVRWFGFIDSNIVYLGSGEKILEYDPKTGKTESCKPFEEITVGKDDTNFCIEQFSQGEFLILKNNRIEFWGDYDKLLGKNGTEAFSKITLAENIVDFDFSEKLVVAVDSNNKAYAWGECLVNGKNNTKTEEYEYFEKKIIMENVKNVCVPCGCDICFVNCSGLTESFRSRDTWGFFGNSDKSEIVGINNKPVVWE